MAEESGKTVVVALGANVAVAVVKFTGAALTGSAALYAEAAESVSDSLNQGLLLRSLHQSRRPADARHPFGYGRERFFWSFLAAVVIFISGAGFSGFEAYRAFAGRSTIGSHYYPVAYAVLAFVFVSEGISWLRAMRQVRGEAAQRDRRPIEHIQTSSDPSVKTVAGEDTVALIGVFLAAGGIGLHQLTGAEWWEGIASGGIAVLLVVTAFLLGRDAKDLLIGRSAEPQLRQQIGDFLGAHRAVDAVVDLLTLRMGANEVLVASRIDLDSSLISDDVEAVSSEIDEEIQRRWPEVTQVFLDATRRDQGQGASSPAPPDRRAEP